MFRIGSPWQIVFSLAVVLLSGNVAGFAQSTNEPPPVVSQEPLPPPAGGEVPLSLEDQILSLPAWKRDQVHIFFINGADPFYCGKLNRLADCYRSLGYSHCECYQMTSSIHVARNIRSIRCQCPEARVVLVGFSAGANCVRRMANRLGQDNIYIDCLVYLGGDYIRDVTRSRPSNAGQIINITAHGLLFTGYDLFFNGSEISGAKNYRLDTIHFGLPKSPHTRDIIGQELVALTMSIPDPVGVKPIEAAPSKMPAATSAHQPQKMQESRNRFEELLAINTVPHAQPPQARLEPVREPNFEPGAETGPDLFFAPAVPFRVSHLQQTTTSGAAIAQRAAQDTKVVAVSAQPEKPSGSSVLQLVKDDTDPSAAPVTQPSQPVMEPRPEEEPLPENGHRFRKGGDRVFLEPGLFFSRGDRLLSRPLFSQARSRLFTME